MKENGRWKRPFFRTSLHCFWRWMPVDGKFTRRIIAAK
jgi:hypothetical protein